MLGRQLTHALRSSSQIVTTIPRRMINIGGVTPEQWIQEKSAEPASITTDVISRQRAEQLHRTLPTNEELASGGSVLSGRLPKAYHLVYFQTEEWLSELANDGTSTEYNAPSPYARRMWAGGSFEWSPNTHLQIGEEATQSVRMAGGSLKAGMMFVNQVREFRPSSAPESQWAIREERNHVFMPTEKAQTKSKPKPAASDMPKPDYTLTYVPNSPLLFRYSALTYNAHKIHYDLQWTQNMEGHPDLVVHGPMTASLLVQLADRAAGDTATELRKFDYRATSPMYVNREIKLQGHWDQRGKSLTLWAEQDGKVGMKATATYESPMSS